MENKYGKWTVLDQSPPGEYARAHWLCQCDCGIKRLVRAASLVNGLSDSCGLCDRKLPRRKKEKRDKAANFTITLPGGVYSELVDMAARKKMNRNEYARNVIVAHVRGGE